MILSYHNVTHPRRRRAAAREPRFDYNDTHPLGSQRIGHRGTDDTCTYDDRVTRH
jgi:hypothetical protein